MAKKTSNKKSTNNKETGSKKATKKPTPRKWNRKHEFKRQKSTNRKVGHPVYLVATSGDDSKYLVFTHKPEEGKEKDYTKLKHNIDPDEKDKDSYVKNKPAVSKSAKLRDPDKQYRIHEDDKELIKNLKKNK